MYSTSDVSEGDRTKKALLDNDNARTQILSQRMLDLEKKFTQSELEKSHDEVGGSCSSGRNAEARPLHASDNNNKGNGKKIIKKSIQAKNSDCMEESRKLPMMSEYLNIKLQLKECQSKCLEKEKKLQASQEKTKFLTKKNQELQEMLTETTKLNMDLQRHIINYFEQSEDIEAAKRETQELQNFPSVGFLRKSDSMIHVGQGIWLSKCTYDAVVYNARKSKRIFVKNMALALFGPEILKSSSVEGRVSNRKKNNNPKTPLDPIKLRAITDIFKYYLEMLKCNEIEIDLWLRRVGSIISSKISDLNRPLRCKKSGNISEDDDEQQENYDQENHQQDSYEQECEQENNQQDSYEQQECEQENNQHDSYEQQECEQENNQQDSYEQENNEREQNDEENDEDNAFVYEFLDSNSGN